MKMEDFITGAVNGCRSRRVNGNTRVDSNGNIWLYDVMIYRAIDDCYNINGSLTQTTVRRINQILAARQVQSSNNEEVVVRRRCGKALLCDGKAYRIVPTNDWWSC